MYFPVHTNNTIRPARRRSVDSGTASLAEYFVGVSVDSDHRRWLSVSAWTVVENQVHLVAN